MSLGVKVPHRQACLPSANLEIWSSGALGISKEKWQVKKHSEYLHVRCKHLNPSAIFNLPEYHDCLIAMQTSKLLTLNSVQSIDFKKESDLIQHSDLLQISKNKINHA